MMENDDKKQNFMMTKKQVLSLAENLSYEEKLKLVFALVPWNDFHNYKYREEVARLALGLPPKPNKKTTGEDLPNLSLKSIKSKDRRKKNNKFVINPTQTLGQWGRIDLDKTFDKKETISDIWGDDSVILRIKIFYDDNFEKLYNSKKEEKLMKKTGKKNKVDMGGFTIKDLLDFGVRYETLYVDKDNVIINFPLKNKS
jgi:hypothetical protein